MEEELSWIKRIRQRSCLPVPYNGNPTNRNRTRRITMKHSAKSIGGLPIWMVCLATALSVLWLGACASTMPAPEGSNDTMLVVLADKEIESGVPSGLSSRITLEIEGVEKTITIKPENPTHLIIGIPPGDHKTTQVTQKAVISGGDWAKGPKRGVTGEFKVAFRMKPGYITVFPVKFVYYQRQARGHTFSHGWDFREVRESEAREILTQLAAQESFSLWKNDFGVK
jgi:hypothetical protein